MKRRKNRVFHLVDKSFKQVTRPIKRISKKVRKTLHLS